MSEVYELLFRCVITALGVAFLSIGIYLARSARRLAHAGVPAHATVVAYESGSKQSQSTFPVVEFEDNANQRHRVRLSCSRGPAVGETMDIIYDPLDPSIASGTSTTELWMGPSIFVVMGLVAIIFAWIGEPSVGQ